MYIYIYVYICIYVDNDSEYNHLIVSIVIDPGMTVCDNHM